ncbi:MAG: hypothetical protein V9E94_12150 [Microthrixaceae bacterium]
MSRHRSRVAATTHGTSTSRPTGSRSSGRQLCSPCAGSPTGSTTTPPACDVDLVDFGASLGVGTGTGRNTQVNRTLGRLIDFRLARIAGDHLEVRTELASVPDGLRRRLPLSLLDSLAEHERTTRAS